MPQTRKCIGILWRRIWLFRNEMKASEKTKCRARWSLWVQWCQLFLRAVCTVYTRWYVWIAATLYALNPRNYVVHAVPSCCGGINPNGIDRNRRYHGQLSSRIRDGTCGCCTGDLAVYGNTPGTCPLDHFVLILPQILFGKWQARQRWASEAAQFTPLLASAWARRWVGGLWSLLRVFFFFANVGAIFSSRLILTATSFPVLSKQGINEQLLFSCSSPISCGEHSCCRISVCSCIIWCERLTRFRNLFLF